MRNWEDYLITGTDTLQNKFNLADIDKLYEKEKDIVLERLIALNMYGINGEFDVNHLKAIHWYLFSPIYPFAGEFREVNLFKEHTRFLGYECIPSEIKRVMFEAKEKEIDDSNLFNVAKFLGDFYYNLITIHPFREENGRTIREYLREFTSYKFPNLSLNYDKVDKNNFLVGITEHDTYPLLIAYEIYNALEKVNDKKI